ncbi:hypothetical protein BN903_34 [Halorubrum sp. AJ67]|nr:hypothetical protein BN903_34 [Halorubrum sp. AJ67]
MLGQGFEPWSSADFRTGADAPRPPKGQHDWPDYTNRA